MMVLLFGKTPARRLDSRRFPNLRKALRKLGLIKAQVAEIAGQPEGLFDIQLCEGGNASISRDGEIGVGKELLEEFPNDDELWVGILGHEIGHAPWSWPNYDLSRMRKKDRDQLYRDEEAKADRFAGRALAELGVSPQRICQFLIASAAFEAHPPSDYYPANVRAEMILDAFRRRSRALDRALAVLGGGIGRRRELR
jgi:hypothetical protein